MDHALKLELARLLAGLRRDRRQQSGLDQRLVPANAAEAYAVAALVEQELARPVLGWKIAAFKQELQRQLRADAPIYGRVYECMPSPGEVLFASQCSPIPEAEYQALLGSDLPPRARPYSIDEVTEAVASLHPGLELAECSFIHDSAFPPLSAVLADGSGAGTLVYGPAIEDWKQRDLVDQPVILRRNGEAVRQGTAREFLDHPMVPLTWLANALSQTGIGLKAGQMISTGTLTGMLKPRQGEHYTADFGDFGSVSALYR